MKPSDSNGRRAGGGDGVPTDERRLMFQHHAPLQPFLGCQAPAGAATGRFFSRGDDSDSQAGGQ